MLTVKKTLGTKKDYEQAAVTGSKERDGGPGLVTCGVKVPIPDSFCSLV